MVAALPRNDPAGKFLVRNIVNLGIVEADDVIRFDPEHDIVVAAATALPCGSIPRPQELD